MGAGLWLASLNVQYRDFPFVVPFLLQFALYTSPVGLSSAIVSAKCQLRISGLVVSRRLVATTGASLLDTDAR